MAPTQPAIKPKLVLDEATMNKLIIEFIGTFFLVLTIGCTGIPSAPGVIPPLAIGAALMVMVYAGGHISGAHYNPAVTLAVFIRGRCPAKEAVAYLITQLMAAIVAALIVGFLVGWRKRSWRSFSSPLPWLTSC